MHFTRLASALLATISAGSAVGPAAGFASPQQPWASPDGNVHLLRPIGATLLTTEPSFGSQMAPGWRFAWDGTDIGPGQLVVALVLKEAPIAPQSEVNDVLQVGVSRDSAVVRGCTTDGLNGGDGQPLPDRTINGQRFTVRKNGDAGMSQGIRAIDLRAVVNGACYAIERFLYEAKAGKPDPAIKLSQDDGGRQLDAALASLQLGPIPTSAVLRPPSIPGKGHGIAR